MSRIRRFTCAQRGFHAVLIVAVVTQAGTGLARLYRQSGWGQALARGLGGAERVLAVHKLAGLVMVALLIAHGVYVLLRIDWSRGTDALRGPDSLVPRRSDLREAAQHVRWMLGRGLAPRFDRWTYWERFDYWAAVWGLCVMGGTGLILYDSVLSTRIVPGWGLNVALWVHRIEATLAMAHLFIIHFFVSHLRRRSFPMDLAMFGGSVALADAREDRPAWIERLERDGELRGRLVQASPPALRAAYYVFGACALSAGLLLLGVASVQLWRLAS